MYKFTVFFFVFNVQEADEEYDFDGGDDDEKVDFLTFAALKFLFRLHSFVLRELFIINV